MALRFNHMELTLPVGSLDAAAREEIGSFYTELFGWEALEVPILGQSALLLRTDPETSQFILVAESRKPAEVPGYDHLGLLLDSRAEVDAVAAKARQRRENDPRIQLKEYEDLEQGDVTVHAFYLRYRLPVWLDVQCMEWKPGTAPARGWRYVPAQSE